MALVGSVERYTNVDCKRFTEVGAQLLPKKLVALELLLTTLYLATSTEWSISTKGPHVFRLASPKVMEEEARRRGGGAGDSALASQKHLDADTTLLVEQRNGH
eukprot:2676850-Amphidinium_carterae.1